MTAEQFERMLEPCLQEVIRTGDVDTIVQRHPQHAEQLRPLLETALLAGRYYSASPEPPPGGLAAGRARLLALANRQREQMHAAPTPSYRRQKVKLVFAAKLVSAILAVIMGATAVGGGIAWAAGDSLPGDVLYPAKLTIENVQLALASTPQARINLNLQFGEERVAEILALVEAGSPVAEPVVTRMEQQFQYALEEAIRVPDSEKAGLLEHIAQRMQIQAQVLERVRAGAPEQAQAGLQRAQHVCLRGYESAQAALGELHQQRNRNNRPNESGPTIPPHGHPSLITGTPPITWTPPFTWTPPITWTPPFTWTPPCPMEECQEHEPRRQQPAGPIAPPTPPDRQPERGQEPGRQQPQGPIAPPAPLDRQPEREQTQQGRQWP